MKVKFFLFFNFLFIPFIFISCSPTSSQDYQTLAAGEMHSFVKLLKKIQDPTDLKKREKRIRNHFNKLSAIMIDYRSYIEKNPEVSAQTSSKIEEAAFLLKGELYRIYELDGGLQLIEEMQKDAYLKLSLFEHSLTQERIDMFKSKKPLARGLK